MKKIILTVAIALTAFTASYAQKGDRTQLTPEQKAEKVATNLKEKLSLSDDQKSKVYQLEVDRMKKAAEWRKDNHEAMKSQMEERKAFMKENDEKLEKILTPDQKKAYDTMREERKTHMKDRRGKHRSAPKADAAQQS
jgi:Spy/CpxP family protein refolding chaperone